MSRTFRTALVLLLAATTFAVLAAAAGAQSFQFRKIVDSGQGLTPDGCPAVNDLGQVAFSAALDSGESGVFLGTRPVILTGQSLDGSVVTNAFVCSEGLSNLGRIAFVAQLEDGRTASSSRGPSWADGRTRRNDEGRVSPPLASLTGCLAAVYWSAQ
jgi:hypothetical protein